ncbi:T9SS type A sorting domain-containing protein [candidate division KSB1 bacterium]|nr:T9SS type A sorting domain-containing protein [candidate division KSB1 bacterium]
MLTQKVQLIRYFFLIFSAFFLKLDLLHAENIEYTYHFQQPAIKNQGDGTQLVQFRDSYPAGIVGSPTLPLAKIALMLPPGQAARDIKIIYKNPQILKTKINLAPFQVPHNVLAGRTPPFRNEKIYNSIEPVKGPQPYIKTHFMNGYAVALSTFSPVEYIPRTQELKFYTEATVKIETGVDQRAIQALENRSSASYIKKRLYSFVDNKTMVDACFGPTIDNPVYDYLIITISEFLENYELLRDFYNQRGIRTRIVSIDWIEKNLMGEDLQDKIRNYIIAEYRQKGIRFVLLAGDADKSKLNGQIQVPARGFFCEVQSSELYSDVNIPADVYYAALDGTWNENNNFYYAEPEEDDLLPEIAVGRICADNPTEIQNMLYKIINYQHQPVVNDAVKVLMVGEKMYDFPETYGSDYLNLLIDGSDANGYSTVGFPKTLEFTCLYRKEMYWTDTDLISKINQGVNLINHAGHSNSNMVMLLNTGMIKDDEFEKVNGKDHLNPVIYSHGCLAGSFDYTDFSGQDCVAEEMLSIQNFAVAFVGNSKYGWFNEGQNEGPSLHLHREFVNALYKDQVTQIGEAHLMSKIRSAPFVTAPNQWEPGALRWCFYCCNVLGDPALDLWTNKIAEFANLQVPDTFFVSSAELVLNIGEPAARVTLSTSDFQFSISMTTEPSGVAFFSGDSLVVHDYRKLMVTKHNFMPYQKEVFIKSPSTFVDNDAKNHLKPNDFQLKAVYPNPFYEKTTIKFYINKTMPVHLAVFNVRGERVANFASNIYEPGEYEINWQANLNSQQILAGGVYFIRITTPEMSLVKRCVLLK